MREIVAIKAWVPPVAAAAAVIVVVITVTGGISL